MRPWWETHPKELWTAVDWREARKLGVVPPLPDRTDPAERLEAQRAQAGQSSPVLPGGLYGDPEAQRANERRRAADKVLQDAGLRPCGW